ncbi:hypothetical protein J5N97_006719 [Dioscorea zingiberensis]|uniref:Uncharacterized protein n=1 Tax=Dioscorea zingiberensis TaxID=325984 RepID=A0A9D5DAN2_9LILI|nr:hypothetical protein J5N97_006719 [Dioscorea zingiberensis]
MPKEKDKGNVMNVVGTISNKEEDVDVSVRRDANELEWEDGTILASESKEAYSHDYEDITIELTDFPSTTQQKPSRRATIEEKELDELVHEVHLLCLLSRGRLVDRVCNNLFLQVLYFHLYHLAYRRQLSSRTTFKFKAMMLIEDPSNEILPSLLNLFYELRKRKH